jgi:hypothetical protein
MKRTNKVLPRVCIIRNPLTGSVETLGSADDVAGMVAELFSEWCKKNNCIGSRLMVMPNLDDPDRCYWYLAPMTDDEAYLIMKLTEEKQCA